MRKNHFPGWARPYEFNAQLFQSIGRQEEARDGVSPRPWSLFLSCWFRVIPSLHKINISEHLFREC